MGQTVEDLERNIALYRQALIDHGHDPTRGHVALLLHTFVGDEAEAVRERARRPFCDYLKSSLDLLQNLVRSQGLQIDFERLSEDDLNYLLSSAYERYVRTSALVGTPETCAPVVQRLAGIGVDELACFIDFGVEAATVLDSLPHLDALRERCCPQPPAPTYELAAEPTRIVRRVPTTDAQRQLWVLTQVGDDASCAYNETLCLRLRGPLNLSAFAGAVQAAVARHEALWTSLSDDGREQIVHAPSLLELPLTDFSGAASVAERESDAAQWLAAECRRKFDLGVAPLLRTHVLRLEQASPSCSPRIMPSRTVGRSVYCWMRSAPPTRRGAAVSRGNRTRHCSLAITPRVCGDLRSWRSELTMSLSGSRGWGATRHTPTFPPITRARPREPTAARACTRSSNVNSAKN